MLHYMKDTSFKIILGVYLERKILDLNYQLKDEFFFLFFFFFF